MADRDANATGALPGDARQRNQDALARELAERLAALATPPPASAGPPSSRAPGAVPRASLAGPRALVENASRWVAPQLPPGAPLHAAKSLLLRVLRIVTRDQTTFNVALSDAVREALAQIEEALRASAEATEARAPREELEETRRRLADEAARVAEAHGRLDALEPLAAAVERGAAVDELLSGKIVGSPGTELEFAL